MARNNKIILIPLLLSLLIAHTQSQCYADTDVPGLLQGSHFLYLDSISLRI